MEEIELRVLKERCINDLWRNASKHVKFYTADSKPNEILDYVEGRSGIYFTIEDLQFINASSGHPSEDAKNAIILHKNLEINETHASDSRFWTCLTHDFFWNYMRKRWPIDPRGNAPANRIKDRYVISSPSLNSLSRNGLSRLWWIAHLTRDDKREDKYELTKVLASRQDLIAGLLERYLGTSRSVRFSVLEFFNENPKLLSNEDVRRLILKNLNLIGGVKNLPFLSVEELKSELKIIVP